MGRSRSPRSRSGLWAPPALVDVDFFKMAWMRVTVDDAGKILSVDATATTERTLTKRVEAVDIDLMEKEFLALDKAGKGLGEASPNVETKATLDGGTITLRYGSPRLRGRSGVLAALVASAKVWRTGANEAATLQTNRDLIIGGERLAAGKYSLWTLPSAIGTQLIVNKETGQWGTSYKPSLDVFRVPMQTTTRETPLENFTIAVQPGGQAELRIEWDAFRWSVPIAVAPVSPVQPPRPPSA